MASGANGSGDPAASPMEATPVTRRSSAEVRAGTSPTSPVAKQARRREIAQLSAPTPAMTHEQLAQEVHRTHLQGEKDSVFFDETHDNIVAYWVPATLPAPGQPLDG